MKTILSLALLCFLQPVFATTYYFSNNSGNDSRSSTQARNPSTPWKTINKLNSFFSNLRPGDQVLFKRGETFYGSIIVSQSGRAGAPIVIGAYGSGDKPVISSLVTLSGWKANSGYKGVYEASANSALDAQLNIVFLNNVRKDIGRFPNLDATNKGYLTIESHSGRKSMTDKQLSSSPNWLGAEVVVRANHWQINKAPIKYHSGRTIYFSGSLYTQNNYGYFIQKSIKTLDQLGEWYYNPSTKKLSMYFGSNSPSSYNVKASAIDILVYAKRRSYIRFDNLTLKGANQSGFDINSGSNIQINNCEILCSGVDGVNVSNHSNFKIENCTVSDSYNNGITTGSSRAIVRNNVVKNSYTVPGMAPGGDGKGIGISVSSNSLAEYNQVINSGYIGIKMSGNDVTVKNNYIDNFCFLKDDGGGIYTYNGHKVKNKGRKIIGNIILNGKGAPEGTNTKNSSAHGIYLDLRVHEIEIRDNTVTSCQRGIFLHNTEDIIIRNNTLYNNMDQIMVTRDGYGGDVRNNTVTNNILFAKHGGQRTLSVNTSRDINTIKAFGTINQNNYARPMDKTGIIFTTAYLYQSKQKKTYHDLQKWKSTFRKDLNSTLSAKTFANNPDANIKFVYNASEVTKTVSLGASYVDAKNKRYSNSITLQPYTSAVLIKDGKSSTTDKTEPNEPNEPIVDKTSDKSNKAPTVSITSPGNNQTFKGPATFRLIAQAKDSDGQINRVEFYNGSTLLDVERHYPYRYLWRNVRPGTYTVTAKAIDNRGASTRSAAVKIIVKKADVQNRQALVGSEEVSNELVSVSLSPNPVSNILNISTKGFQQNKPVTISVLSISGVLNKTINTSASNQVVQVDVSSLQRGVYMVRIISGGRMVTKQFVKL